ncbi:hypothetical protein CRYUN_Cryun07bG0038600 [Craigia yunnanensis]
MASIPAKHDDQEDSLISFFSIPDGLESEDDRNDAVKFTESIRRVMPGQLKKLVEKINHYGTNNEQKISCFIDDVSVGWPLEVAKNMGIDGVAVHTAGPAGMALALRVPQLIEARILGDDGPLLANNHSGSFAGSFWPEDSTCLSWLDKQTASSVIYVAFGSIAILNTQQLDELALGLKLSGHPYIWVVRSNFTKSSSTKFPEGFAKRVADRGKIVEWTPQEKVLAHPSVAYFLSHCGWNSTMEGLSMGVPFLCWPYFADQFHNRNYICEVWNIGLPLIRDENGIITRHEISAKIKTLKKLPERVLTNLDLLSRIL